MPVPANAANLSSAVIRPPCPRGWPVRAPNEPTRLLPFRRLAANWQAPARRSVRWQPGAPAAGWFRGHAHPRPCRPLEFPHRLARHRHLHPRSLGQNHPPAGISRHLAPTRRSTRCRLPGKVPQGQRRQVPIAPHRSVLLLASRGTMQPEAKTSAPARLGCPPPRCLPPRHPLPRHPAPPVPVRPGCAAAIRRQSHQARG